MKLALVVPESNAQSDKEAPLNLAGLASYIRQEIHSCEIKVFDGAFQQNIKQRLLDFQPDAVGVTATTPQIIGAYNLLDALKRNKPDILTVMGGIHASCLPEEALEHADCVVVGEGEKALLQILKLYTLHLSIPKIIHGEPFENLDELPPPAYDLLDMSYYSNCRISSMSKLTPPIASLMTSRGCNYHCPFCYNSTRRSKVRYNSAKRIIQDITSLIDKYDIKSFWFHDDEFLANKKRLKEFIDLLRENQIKIIWGCCARVDSLDEETVKLIKNNGCLQVFLGVESATPKTLNYLKCGTVSLQNIERTLKVCQKHALSVYGSFIFGSPNETLSDMKQTRTWINKHRKEMLDVGYGVLTPYPGSKIWNEWQSKIGQIDYSRLDFNLPIDKRYIVDEAISLRDFSNFMQVTSRLTWFINQMVSKVSLRKLVMLKTFWWVLISHPKYFLSCLLMTQNKK